MKLSQPRRMFTLKNNGSLKSCSSLNYFIISSIPSDNEQWIPLLTKPNNQAKSALNYSCYTRPYLRNVVWSCSLREREAGVVLLDAFLCTSEPEWDLVSLKVPTMGSSEPQSFKYGVCGLMHLPPPLSQIIFPHSLIVTNISVYTMLQYSETFCALGRLFSLIYSSFSLMCLLTFSMYLLMFIYLFLFYQSVNCRNLMFSCYQVLNLVSEFVASGLI